MSDAAKLTERFRRVNFGRVEVDVTLDDPKVYTRPWTVTLVQKHRARHRAARLPLHGQRERRQAHGGKVDRRPSDDETDRNGAGGRRDSSDHITSTRSGAWGLSMSSPSPAAAMTRGRRKAEALGAQKGYGSYQALLDDPDVQVVHNATPNYLHYEVTSAALARGKHVVSDKPLAMTSAQAKRLVNEAQRAGVVSAVTFNYRGNPLVQQARNAIARGDIGTPHFLHGHYLQDWLLKDTDYSWRLDPEKGGASSALGDIGSHWCDLAQHVTGLRITHVLGDITTVVKKRKKPTGSREAFQAGDGDDGEHGGHQSRGPGLRARPVRQRRARLLLGRTGVRRAQERPRARGVRREGLDCDGGRRRRTSSGLAIVTTPTRCCRRILSLLDTDVRRYAHLPGGHQEAWADAFCNLMREIYRCIAAGPPYPTPFPDGRHVRGRLPCQSHCRCDPRKRCGRRGVDARMTRFEPKFMKVGDPHRRAAGADAARAAGCRSRSGDRRLAGVRTRTGCRRHSAFGGASPIGVGRAAGSDARSGREHARPAAEVRRRASAPRPGRDEVDGSRSLRPRLLRQSPSSRPSHAPEEARLPAAGLRCSGPPRRDRRLRFRWPQSAAQHGPEPDRLRAALHPAAPGREAREA